MREVRFPEPADCNKEDCKAIKQLIISLNQDIQKLDDKIGDMAGNYRAMLTVLSKWNTRIELFRRLTEFRKEGGFGLTEEEYIIRFCNQKLDMSYQKIADVLGISKGTVHNKLKLIEKKIQRKEEVDREKELNKESKYQRMYPMKKPKRYKKSVYRDM